MEEPTLDRLRTQLQERGTCYFSEREILLSEMFELIEPLGLGADSVEVWHSREGLCLSVVD